MATAPEPEEQPAPAPVEQESAESAQPAEQPAEPPEQAEEEEEEEFRPAWSLLDQTAAAPLPVAWPQQVTRDWAFGDAKGKDVRVCVLDSGVDAKHPFVGELEGAVSITVVDGETHVEQDKEGDLCGHGTACAGIIRSLAPECRLFSVRVLGAGFTGSGDALLAGLRWAVDQGYDVINMSLSTTKKQFATVLHDLADSAYFRKTVLVASAHNMPVESYPWRFSSVISVGSHAEPDPLTFYANPDPPVEFFGHGVDVEIAWLDGAVLRASGNSFATPHIAGICTRVLGAHHDLTPFQLKSVLYLIADNVGGRG